MCLCSHILDALHKRGFRTNQGIHDTGVIVLILSRGGGYYLGIYLLHHHFHPRLMSSQSLSDVGASQLIAEGKIKLKNDSQIEEFTETGLLFEDGSQLLADVVIFATGYVAFSCL